MTDNMDNSQRIIEKIFELQDHNGCWKLLLLSDKRYPVYLHYVPMYRATLWTLLLLADIGHDPHDGRVRKQVG